MPSRTLIQIRTHAQKFFQKNDFGMKYDRITEGSESANEKRRIAIKVMHGCCVLILESEEQESWTDQLPVHFPHFKPTQPHHHHAIEDPESYAGRNRSPREAQRASKRNTHH